MKNSGKNLSYSESDAAINNIFFFVHSSIDGDAIKTKRDKNEYPFSQRTATNFNKQNACTLHLNKNETQKQCTPRKYANGQYPFVIEK